MVESRDVWEDFEPHLRDKLGDEDDLELWQAVVSDVYRDAEYLCRHNPKQRWIDTVIGRCSHWLRPHQTRWTADGGFAWPSGYDGPGFSRTGLPIHDWSVRLFFDFEHGSWQLDDPRKRFDPRSLVTFRVAIPGRTTRHPQAAVHTLWTPGSPPQPKLEAQQLYGYRKRSDGWQLRATTAREGAYEAVAKALSS